MTPPKRTRKRPSAAERKRREEQRAKDQGKEVDAEQVNGVMIIRTESEGNLDVKIAPLGDVKMTELPTILRIAVRQVDHELGIANT